MIIQVSDFNGRIITFKNVTSLLFVIRMGFPSTVNERMKAVLSCAESEVKQLTLLLLGDDSKRSYQLKYEIDE